MADEFQIISDIHLNFTGGDAPELQPVDGITGVIATGDFGDDISESGALPWFADRFAGVPIAVVLGNHDIWDSGKVPGLTYERIHERTAEQCYKLGIHYLHSSSALMGTTRVIGATLGTDFRYLPPGMSQKEAMYKSQTGKRLDGYGMFDGRDYHNDFRCTHMLDEKGKRVRYTPRRFIAEHEKSVAFLTEQLAIEHADGATIVATHMAPTPRLRQPGGRWSHDWMYFVGGPDRETGLEYMMHGDTAPELWISGHVHHSNDIEIGNTRCISNPRGYPTRVPGVFENPNWNPALVISVEKRLDLTPSLGM